MPILLVTGVYRAYTECTCIIDVIGLQNKYSSRDLISLLCFKSTLKFKMLIEHPEGETWERLQ